MSGFCRLIVIGIVALSAGFLGGCRWQGETQVAIGEALEGQTVDVDIVGVSEQDYEVWRDYSVDKYFGAQNDQRANARKLTLSFTQGSPQSVRVSSQDGVWSKQWHDSTYLVVMANPPGYGSNSAKDPMKDPAKDARKCILNRNDMKGGVLRILVGSRGLSVTVE